MNLASFRMLGAVLSIVSFGLAGCSSLSGLDGTSSYGCKAPEGVKCLSVSGTYYNALQNNLAPQKRLQPLGRLGLDHEGQDQEAHDRVRGQQGRQDQPQRAPPAQDMPQKRSNAHAQKLTLL